MNGRKLKEEEKRTHRQKTHKPGTRFKIKGRIIIAGNGKDDQRAKS